MTMKGIDISAYQRNVDFNKVKASGIDFAIIRAGYGSIPEQMDKCFMSHVKGAKAAGLHVGAYWFVYAENEKEASKNARAFIEVLSKVKGLIDFPVAIDFEGDSTAYMRRMGVKPNKRLNTNICKIIAQELQAAGYKVIMYLNPDYIHNHVNYNELKGYDLWLAQYSSSHSIKCDIWQHTSIGSVPGINGNVDMNIAYKDYTNAGNAAGTAQNGNSSDATGQQSATGSGKLTLNTFDYMRYANDYPDVKRAFGYDKAALWRHYQMFGIKEKRKAYALTIDTFNHIRYADDYSDVKKAFGYDKAALWRHYQTFGGKEGRRAYTK